MSLDKFLKVGLYLFLVGVMALSLFGLRVPKLLPSVWLLVIHEFSGFAFVGHTVFSNIWCMRNMRPAGEIVREYPFDGAGWSHIALCNDGIHVLVNSIWEGTFIKVNLETGEIVGEVDTGFKAPNRCVAGIAVYPGSS